MNADLILAPVPGLGGIFDALLVVVDVRDTSVAELSRAIGIWTEVLKLKGEAAVLEQPIFENRDPWFGFGVRVHGNVLPEREVLAALGDAPAAPVEAFVDALVAFNQENAERLEGGLVTHEELETGSAAVEWLVLHELGQLPRYLQFLEGLELAHTVEQVAVVHRLAKRYSPAELAPLVKWASERGARLLNDWLENERVWKV